MPRNSPGSRIAPWRKSSRAAACRSSAAAPDFTSKPFSKAWRSAARRRKLRAELEAAPLENLLAELRERDPAAYEKIDKKNPRRVIRAVEVIRLTGKPFSRSARIGTHVTRHLPLVTFSVSHASRRICTPASTPAWTQCSRAVWWTRRANCSSAASRKTKRRCRPSATGRWWSILRGEREKRNKI
jgi:hypothetical protein